MKLRYYLSGLGSGIIIAVLIMLIADKVTAVNNNVNGSNVPQETTGSVIAYTTQSDKDNETIQAESTEHSENKGNEDTTSADTAKNSVVKATDSSTTDTTRYVSEEDKVIVNINPKNIKVASDFLYPLTDLCFLAELLEDGAVLNINYQLKCCHFMWQHFILCFLYYFSCIIFYILFFMLFSFIISSSISLL